LEKSANPLLQDTHAPVADEVLRRLSDEELRLIRDALRRGLDEEEFPTELLGVSLEEKAALERFSKLYEEERRGL